MTTTDASTDSNPADTTAGDAVYPSDTLPGIPPFTFPVPEGWVVEPSLDALAVARIPVADDGFWASIIVTANRVPSGLKLRDAVESTYRQFLRRYPDAKLQGERLAAYDGRETYVRVVEVVGDDGRAVSQLHAYFFAPIRGDNRVRELFQFVASAPTEHQDKYGKAVVDSLNGFRFT
jgi:hypothetical protein